MDTRYLISNSKDQSIKLWDMRHFSDESTIETIRIKANSINNGWDYRYDAYGPQRTDSVYFIFNIKIRVFVFI